MPVARRIHALDHVSCKPVLAQATRFVGGTPLVAWLDVELQAGANSGPMRLRGHCVGFFEQRKDEASGRRLTLAPFATQPSPCLARNRRFQCGV